MIIHNAKIESTMLGTEDHGIFTCWLNLTFGSSGQGFGGYCFDTPLKEGDKFIRRIGTAYGCDAIMQILKTLGVERWEKLPGTVCRVKKESDFGRILAIGHFLDDKWLSLDELAEQHKDN